jgi:hypothetical protein
MSTFRAARQKSSLILSRLIALARGGDSQLKYRIGRAIGRAVSVLGAAISAEQVIEAGGERPQMRHYLKMSWREAM